MSSCKIAVLTSRYPILHIKVYAYVVYVCSSALDYFLVSVWAVDKRSPSEGLL